MFVWALFVVYFCTRSAGTSLGNRYSARWHGELISWKSWALYFTFSSLLVPEVFVTFFLVLYQAPLALTYYAVTRAWRVDWVSNSFCFIEWVKDKLRLHGYSREALPAIIAWVCGVYRTQVIPLRCMGPSGFTASCSWNRKLLKHLSVITHWRINLLESCVSAMGCLAFPVFRYWWSIVQLVTKKPVDRP